MNDEFGDIQFSSTENTMVGTGLEGLVRRQTRRSVSASRAGRKVEAVVLLRVSSPRQLNTAADVESDGNSIATQREWADRKAAELGATVVKEFVEPGHSAQTIAHRPIFRQMLEFVRENAETIGYVVIYSRSRAFRNLYDASDVEKEFQGLGVELVSATEDFGNDPDNSAFMKHVTDGMNHLHVRMNGRDVAKKLLHKVENGGSVGRAKIGYLNDRKDFDGRLVTTISVDPLRAPLIKWAFEAYATGEYSLTSLRDALADQGLTTRPTRRWPQQPISHNQLSNVLRDPYYAGVILYKGELYPGRHEPLITKELYLRVQNVLNERAQRGQRDVYHHHWVKGLIWCERCQKAGRASRLIFTEAKGNGGTYGYYICRGRQEGLCDLPSLPIADVEDRLARAFGTLAIGQDFVDSIRSDIDAALERAQWMDREMRTNIRAKLRQLDIKEERLLDLAAEADVATLRLADRLKAMELERGNLQEKLARADTHIQRGVDTVRAYLNLLVSPDSLFNMAGDSERRGLLEAFFSGIWLDSDGPPRVEQRAPVKEILGAASTLRRLSAGESFANEFKTQNDDLNIEIVADGLQVGLLSLFLIFHGLSKPTLAGVPGLEPRTKESESSVLPITPYPTEPSRNRAD
jgi:site-specific DNA recombinase